MKRSAKIALLVSVFIIAVTAITATTLGCTHTSTPTPQPTVVATPTPTSQPTVIATPTHTPAGTTAPTATPQSTQTNGPTPTPTPQPTVIATPTQTPSKTTAPTTTPQSTQTSVPTPTPSGGSGGSSPTPTHTTTPNQTQTTVSINAPNQVKQGSTFTIDININNVSDLDMAGLDLQFNSSCVSYSACNTTCQIGNVNGTVYAGIMQPGLLRVISDYSDYAITNSGYGVSGSGCLCKLTFSATAQGTSQLAFVKGQGAPLGELMLVKVMAYNISVIENVSWTNSSITVVKN